MTYRVVIDTYAWVEYFKGTRTGEKVNSLLEENCFTPTIVIAELSDKYAKEKHNFLEQDLAFIREHSVILALDAEIAKASGRLKNEVRKKYKTNFGLADAIVLATARKIGAKVVTGDCHFRPLRNVEYLG